jgi:2,4-dienoyl-CoA reductase-like NADH-dependent reductase (Old Yellow Enzyme family)
MQVFEASSLASIRMKNRILRSATYEGMCDNLGHPQPSYYELYDKVSRGGTGAIITGYVAVNRTGRMPRLMGIIDDDSYIEEFGKLSTIVHVNDTPIIMRTLSPPRPSSIALCVKPPGNCPKLASKGLFTIL